MPWPKEHKALTRERIVEAAAAAFRRRGVSGVRVDEIMADAGLTHGGFYAHFSSKDELLGAALAHASGQTLDTLSKRLESLPVERRLHAVIDAYLSPGHAASPGYGCPVAALGPELARTRGRAQRDLARAVRRRLDWLHELDTSTGRGSGRDDEAVGTLSCLIGGLILARIVGGGEGEALLASCREFLHRAVGAKTTVAPAKRRAAAPHRKRSPRRRSDAA